MDINNEALDRHITGNYGEDQFETGYCDSCDRFLSEKEFEGSTRCEKCRNNFCDSCYEDHFACGVQ